MSEREKKIQEQVSGGVGKQSSLERTGAEKFIDLAANAIDYVLGGSPAYAYEPAPVTKDTALEKPEQPTITDTYQEAINRAENPDYYKKAIADAMSTQTFADAYQEQIYKAENPDYYRNIPEFTDTMAALDKKRESYDRVQSIIDYDTETGGYFSRNKHPAENLRFTSPDDVGIYKGWFNPPDVQDEAFGQMTPEALQKYNPPNEILGQPVSGEAEAGLGDLVGAARDAAAALKDIVGAASGSIPSGRNVIDEPLVGGF
jgi:hypothetical protein